MSLHACEPLAFSDDIERGIPSVLPARRMLIPPLSQIDLERGARPPGNAVFDGNTLKLPAGVMKSRRQPHSINFKHRDNHTGAKLRLS